MRTCNQVLHYMSFKKEASLRNDDQLLVVKSTQSGKPGASTPRQIDRRKILIEVVMEKIQTFGGHYLHRIYTTQINTISGQKCGQNTKCLCAETTDLNKIFWC